MDTLSEEEMLQKYVFPIELLLWSSTNGSEIKENDNYCTYYFRQCGITNPRLLHIWLLEHGYLRTPTFDEILNTYSLKSLKEYAKILNCKVSGTKKVLSERISDILSEKEKEATINSSKLHFLSEKGWNFYLTHYEYVDLHLSKYGIKHKQYQEYIKDCSSHDFESNARQILIEELQKSYTKNEYFHMAVTFNHLFLSYYKSAEYDIALKIIIYSLYMFTNCAQHFNYIFNPYFIKLFGVKDVSNRIKEYDIFLPFIMNKISKLKEYYDEYMVDEVYGASIMPCTLFDSTHMKMLLLELFNNISINKTFYLEIIKNNYIAFIKNNSTTKRKFFFKKETVYPDSFFLETRKGEL